jgi:hypothetical protein
VNNTSTDSRAPEKACADERETDGAGWGKNGGVSRKVMSARSPLAALVIPPPAISATPRAIRKFSDVPDDLSVL